MNLGELFDLTDAWIMAMAVRLTRWALMLERKLIERLTN